MQQENYQAALFPHAYAMLETLKGRGITLAIATSKNRKEIDSAIKYHNLLNIFDLICCGNEYQNKPDPTMLKHIMGKFNVMPDECLMVGDTTTDMLFAENAGVQAMAVTFGAHSETNLQLMKPFAVIDEWKQFSEVIDKLCLSTQTYYQSSLRV